MKISTLLASMTIFLLYCGPKNEVVMRAAREAPIGGEGINFHSDDTFEKTTFALISKVNFRCTYSMKNDTVILYP